MTKVRVNDLPPVPARQAVKHDPQQDPKLKAACQEMEAVFLNLLLRQMRASVPKTNLLGDSASKDTMQSLLDTEMTKNMADAGGIGIADMLYRQLTPSTTKSRAPQ